MRRVYVYAIGQATVALAAVAAFAWGCGGSDGGSNPNPAPQVLAKAPSASGDQQTGPVSSALPNDLRIVVTRDGSPEAGVTVNWSTTDGSLDPTSGPTDASGIAATAGPWERTAVLSRRRQRYRGKRLPSHIHGYRDQWSTAAPAE